MSQLGEHSIRSGLRVHDEGCCDGIGQLAEHLIPLFIAPGMGATCGWIS